MVTLAAIIITKNAAQDIAACIESVLWTDEIIVLDSGSSDGTQEICRKYKVKLLETDWPGFGKQKNRALDMVTTEWAFSIDADEIVTPELQNEIKEVLRAQNDFAAFSVPRQNFFLGKAIKHCWKNDAPIKLLRKQFASFDDALVHESVIVTGKIGVLQSYLLHYPFKTLAEQLQKINAYSTAGAEKLFVADKRSSLTKALVHSVWAFVRLYIFKLGCLDGWAGFLIALGNFEGTFYRYAKLWERSKR